MTSENVNVLCNVFSTLVGATSGNEVTEVAENEKHPRMHLYKNRGHALDQERRWRSELAMERSSAKRKANFDKNRTLSEDPYDVCVTGARNPWASKPKDKESISSWRSRASFLMLAEWFLFMPPNFSNEYLLKLCPRGRHVFVIAEKGQTKIYSRLGHCLATLLSRLPGGGLGQSSAQMHRNKTMLDGILIGEPTASITHKIKLQPDETESSTVVSGLNDADCQSTAPLLLMVLDLVHFRTSDYRFEKFRQRCEWLESYHRDQLESYEEGDVMKVEVLPAYGCQVETMQAIFNSKPTRELDGVLFYHEDVAYRRGPTPLIGWLKPYMIPEWFPQVALHEAFLSGMSTDYAGYLADIQRYEERSALDKKNKQVRSPNNSTMDHSPT